MDDKIFILLVVITLLIIINATAIYKVLLEIKTALQILVLIQGPEKLYQDLQENLQSQDKHQPTSELHKK